MNCKRLILFLILLFGLIYAIWAIIDECRNDENTQINQLKTELCKSDPLFEQQIAKLEDERSQVALACTLHYYQKKSINALKALTKVSTDFKGTLPLQQFFELALEIEQEGGDVTSFFNTHNIPLMDITETKSVEYLTSYIADLKAIKESGGIGWDTVKKDPAALGIWKNINGERELWEFYCHNSNWLSPLFSTALVFSTVDQSSEYMTDKEYRMVTKKLSEDCRNWLSAVKKHTTLCRTLCEDVEKQIKNENEDSFNEIDGVYSLLLPTIAKYGVALEQFRRAGYPIYEAFVVLNLSRTLAEKYVTKQDELGIKLAHVYQNKKAVWECAMTLPDVLWLNERIPAYSEEICEKFGQNNATVLLLNEYGENDNLLTQAGKAIVTYGDVGFAVLQTYTEDTQFRRYLADSRVGFRIVPMIGKFDTKAFERLEDNIEWLNRYFDENGAKKEEKTTFIELCPFVGGIATVAKHWSNGYPCEWSEIGWAALDVADTALFIASFGVSTAATSSAKAGSNAVVKNASKGAGKEIIKKTARGALNSGLKKIPISTGKTAMKRGSLKALKALSKLAGWTVKLALEGGKYVARGAKLVAKGIGKAYRYWQTLPPDKRRLIYRSLATLILAHTLLERTIPEIGPYISQKTAEIIGSTVTAVINTPAQLARELADRNNWGINRVKVSIWAILIVVFSCLLWRLRTPKQNLHSTKIKEI